LANQSVQQLTVTKSSKRNLKSTSIKNSENCKILIQFLIDSIKYECGDFEKEMFNRSSEIVGIVPAALRLILITSDFDEESKINFGRFGLIPIILGSFDL
jgi:hypothetical protein